VVYSMSKYSSIYLITVLIIMSVLLLACRNGANATPLPLLTQASPTPREVAPTPVISEKTTLLPYTHSSGRFSLSYPQAWQPFERSDGVIFIEPQAQAGYSVIFSDVEKPYSPEELNQYLVTFIAQNFAGEGSNFKAISQEEGEDGAVVAQFSSTDPNLGQAVSQVTVRQERNTIFVLHLSATEPQWEVSAQPLQALTGKFTALEVKAPAATAQTPAADAPTWALIGPKSNEFGLLYADDWQVVAQEENLVAVAQLENSMSFTATNFLWPASSKESEAAIEAAQAHLKTLSEEVQALQSLPPAEFPLDQITGATIDFVYVAEDGTQMAGSIITGLANGKMHQIVFTAPADLYEAALQWFNPMYKSFKILAPADLTKENP
jgi:hypothetical protein